MSARASITVSIDDGHPMDLRVADLLDRHGLRATFYVPRRRSMKTLDEGEIRELSTRFEIGSHTIDHVRLSTVDEQTARREIFDSRAWLEQVTGAPCRVFSPPEGLHTSRDVDLIRAAGYRAYRTVEMMSLDRPRDRGGLVELPTTLQAHPHGPGAYWRNVVRRGTMANARLLLRCRGGDWVQRAGRLADRAVRRGGVFHLWGHSWEIDTAGQWGALDEMFAHLARLKDRADALTNGEVAERSRESRVGGPSGAPHVTER